MSRLQKLLRIALTEKGIKSSYELLPWRIVYVHHNWDTSFVLYLLNKPIVRGSISDKTFTVLSTDPDTINKIVQDFAVILPKYKSKPFSGGAI